MNTIDIMDTFYDDVANIYNVDVISKKGSDIKVKTLLYEGIKCGHYIATRGNVVNYQPDLGNRQQDLDRVDMVIPGVEYDVTKEIKQGQYVEISDGSKYIIDQLDYYRMPDGTLESIYIRLNQKGK